MPRAPWSSLYQFVPVLYHGRCTTLFDQKKKTESVLVKALAGSALKNPNMMVAFITSYKTILIRSKVQTKAFNYSATAIITILSSLWPSSLSLFTVLLIVTIITNQWSSWSPFSPPSSSSWSSPSSPFNNHNDPNDHHNHHHHLVLDHHNHHQAFLGEDRISRLTGFESLSEKYGEKVLTITNEKWK